MEDRRFADLHKASGGVERPFKKTFSDSAREAAAAARHHEDHGEDDIRQHSSGEEGDDDRSEYERRGDERAARATEDLPFEKTFSDSAREAAAEARQRAADAKGKLRRGAAGPHDSQKADKFKRLADAKAGSKGEGHEDGYSAGRSVGYSEMASHYNAHEKDEDPTKGFKADHEGWHKHLTRTGHSPHFIQGFHEGYSQGAEKDSI